MLGRLKKLCPEPIKKSLLRFGTEYRNSPIRKRLAFKFRRLTWRGRDYPDFIIIGSQKSGTTSLFHYLAALPGFKPSKKKEIKYFDGGLHSNMDSFHKGEQWYKSYFPLFKNFRKRNLSYEASTSYIFKPHAAERILQTIPDVKLIALLRNPTERAISHYFHNVSKGREPLSIEQALQEEETRINQAVNAEDYRDKNYQNFSYKKRGLYIEHIENYLKYFPRERLLIINSEDLFIKKNETLNRICHFLDVKTDIGKKEIGARNVSKTRTKIDPKVYSTLDEYFETYNKALFELIGEDFGW